MNYSFNRLRHLSVLLLLTLFTFVSCGNDEPDLVIGYYMDIQSQVRLNLSESDENQGTTSQSVTDVMSITILNMKKALREAYPETTLHGADAKVINACDSVYRHYYASYADAEKNTVCVVTLCRARMDGTVVKKSFPIKTYRFGVIPENNNPIGN